MSKVQYPMHQHYSPWTSRQITMLKYPVIRQYSILFKKPCSCKSKNNCLHTCSIHVEKVQFSFVVPWESGLSLKKLVSVFNMKELCTLLNQVIPSFMHQGATILFQNECCMCKRITCWNKFPLSEENIASPSRSW